ncbi:hypothetical protein ACOME3_001558 [Neoechinorhynchus agilis]
MNVVLVNYFKRTLKLVRNFYIRSDKQYPIELIRNVGVSAHIDSGKTTLSERILFYAGRIAEIHEVKGRDGVGATMDSMELERQRGITIQSAATSVEWMKHNINLIDTPGHVDFTVEVERALRVLDGAVLVVCGTSGVQCQTLTVHRQIQRYSIPHLIFINKLDRPNASVNRTMRDIRGRLNKNVALMNILMGKEGEITGIIDLIRQCAMYFKGQYGEEIVEDDIPLEYREKASDMLDDLIGHVAETDEEIGEMVLNDTRPETDRLKTSIRRSVIAQQFVPVFVGSALKNKGVQCVLNGIIDFLPNPSERINQAIDNNASTDDKKVYVNCNSSREADSPLLAFAFKLELGKFGQLTYLRIYQGVLTKNQYVHNVRTRKRTKIAKLYRMHADKMEEIENAYAGDICTIAGAEASTGDTLTSDRSVMYSMESISVAEPVISMTFEPADKNQAESFSKAVNRFQKEDPTFRIRYDEDTKQILALGMGELHLEIYATRVEREYGVKIKLGNPKVAYIETIAEPFRFDHLHKKQTGGQGQYGRVIGIIEPLPQSRYLDVEFSKWRRFLVFSYTH